MAVKTIEELLEAVKARIGEDNSDEAIALIEDIQDTYSELNNSGNEDWKKKYEENDNAWRTKYRERFFSKTPDKDVDEEEEQETKKLSYEDLFKEEE